MKRIPSRWSISCWTIRALRVESFKVWGAPLGFWKLTMISFGRSMIPQMSGMLRQPSSSSYFSSENWRISGFIIEKVISSFVPALSLTMIARMLWPTWGAARPTPFWRVISFSISLRNFFSLESGLEISSDFLRRMGLFSPCWNSSIM